MAAILMGQLSTLMVSAWDSFEKRDRIFALDDKKSAVSAFALVEFGVLVAIQSEQEAWNMPKATLIEKTK